MPLITALLLVSVVGLLIGPLLVQVSSNLEKTGAALDGFALITVGGLVVLHLLPEAIAHGGWAAIGFAIAGLLAPLWIDRSATRGDGSVKALLLLVGLAPHAAVESAALGVSSHESALALGVSIAAHRLPVGLILFSMVRQQHGPARGWAAICVLVVATLVGFWLGETSSGILLDQPYSWLQALVGGSLLHVAFSHHLHDCTTHAHSHEEHPEHPEHNHSDETSRWSASGALLGALVLAVALGTPTGHEHNDALHGVLPNFWNLVLRTSPLLLLGYLLAGLTCGVLGPKESSWLATPRRIGQALRGMAFGVRMPVLSCGVLPMYETLRKAAVPSAAALGFLVATPGIGLETLLFSLPLLGTELTVARLVVVVSIALITSLLLSNLTHSDDGQQSDVPAPAVAQRTITSGLRFGFSELFDHTIPWILAGLLVASCMEPLLTNNLLQGVPAAGQVVLLAMVGIPFYVCASGATPVAAMAIHQGISPGAALAFLVVGPATNLTTFSTLNRHHPRRLGWVLGAIVTGSAVLAGLVVDSMAISALNHHYHQAGESTVLGLSAFVVLAAMAVLSLFRQGPRGMLSKISSPMETKQG